VPGSRGLPYRAGEKTLVVFESWQRMTLQGPWQTTLRRFTPALLHRPEGLLKATDALERIRIMELGLGANPFH
jgi:hypothetical protein